VKGDFSRLTFRRERHYSSVRLQQGRVQLDADWNEQVDIQAHRNRTAARDTVGPRGAPLGEPDGFRLSVGAGGPRVGAGRYYVDGILCENEADVDLASQPDLPGAALPTQAGNYLAYLDVWQRHVTAVEDPAIREVALAGPDTATRTQTVWQVKLERITGTPTCDGFGDDWRPGGVPDANDAGRLRARARPSEEGPDDPCIVPPGAGYTRLENQLYRVEIHDGGEPYGARSPQVESTAIQEGPSSTNTVLVANAARPWRVDQWVELFKGGSNEPGKLARIIAVERTGSSTTLTFGGDDLSALPQKPDRLRPVATFKFSRHNGSTLARLEGISEDLVTVSDPGRDPTLGFAEASRVELSDEGRTLRGEPGVMVEVASVMGNDLEVVWPGAPLTMADFPTRPGVGTPPTARRWDSDGAIPLQVGTEWLDLEDGVQVGFEEGVFRGGDYWLIPARSLGGGVEWPQTAGLNPQPSFVPAHGVEHRYAPLGILGLANATWSLRGNRQEDWDCREVFPSLTRLRADKVAYEPSPQCRGLENTSTVQEAIDELCKTGPGAEGVRILDVRTATPDDALANDATVPVSALAGGLRVETDAPVDPDALSGKPTCLVTLDMPYPFGEEEQKFWETEGVIGYRPLVLRGDVDADERGILWAPAREIDGWLRETLFEKMAAHDRGDTIVAHLTLKGNFIWAREDPALLLDGEAVAAPGDRGHPSGLELPSGDDRRGGDFEMWFRIRSELFSVRSVVLDPTEAIGGNVVQGTVETHGTVTRDTSITVESDDPGVAHFGDGQGQITVQIPSGSSQATFQVFTRPTLADRSVTISAVSEAARETVKTATLTVRMPALDNIFCDPNPVPSGGSSRGRVSWRGLAPANMEIQLSVDRDLVRLPATIKATAGSSSQAFSLSVSEDAVTGETFLISATYGNENNKVDTTLTIS
jgi:hypothetical protein